MNFPRFWARGGHDNFFCWRWSNLSLADAQALADQAAQQLADRFRSLRSGAFPPKNGGYYPDRPFREQIMSETKNAAGETLAVVTRNSCGCLVLNTAQAMFVDIDLPEPKKPRRFLGRLFGAPARQPPADTYDAAMTRIENWTRNHSGWGWRIYRTRAGLRLLATQGPVVADSPETEGIFTALGADPLYRKLCKTQKCFRARLTPKPWRCGIKTKPERWPWLEERQEKRFKKWEAQYLTFSASWATCEFIRHLGNSQIHPDIRVVLNLHDVPTRAESVLQLA